MEKKQLLKANWDAVSNKVVYLMIDKPMETELLKLKGKHYICQH
jgi:hypothetical protein